MIALDTSVLIPALVVRHPAHGPCLRVLRAAAEDGGVICAHALAETWSVLTRLPLPRPVSPDLAERMVVRLADRLTVVDVDVALQREAIRRCVLAGVRSGAVHDALHLVAAARAGCGSLVTLNARDFERLRVAEDPGIAEP